MPSSIASALESCRSRLKNALSDAKREADSATLLAVSKTKPAEQLEEAYAAGQRVFGENYLQEALSKQQALSHHADIEWHFIGAIQSNKTRDVAEHFAWAHGVDREKIARRLSDQRPSDLPPINICLQVNISHESSKGGIDEAELFQLAESVLTLPNVQLRGLMALPEPSDNFDQQRQSFAKVRQLFEALQTRFPEATFDTLSMGMSGDLEAAIAEGATIVRIGSAIFGARN